MAKKWGTEADKWSIEGDQGGTETDGASKEDEALKEIEIDPRMNNVTSKALN